MAPELQVSGRKISKSFFQSLIWPNGLDKRALKPRVAGSNPGVTTFLYFHTANQRQNLHTFGKI